VRLKFGSFKCFMINSTSFWTLGPGILCAWRSWTCWVSWTCWGEEVLQFPSSILGGLS
jgi:hypothetical protein